jgi:hypothetical protein
MIQSTEFDLADLAPRESAGIRSGQRRPWMAPKTSAPMSIGNVYSVPASPTTAAQTHTLATPTESVSFRVQLGGQTVTVVRRSSTEPNSNGRKSMSLADARAEYRRLLAKGYYPW